MEICAKFSESQLFDNENNFFGDSIILISILALPVGNWSTRDIDFNEQFRWDAALDMHNSYRLALKRGLPYPILTVAEYFSLGREGFAWGGQYRAGNR